MINVGAKVWVKRPFFGDNVNKKKAELIPPFII